MQIMFEKRFLSLAVILLLCACKTALPSGEVVFAYEPATWFEDGYSRLSISPAGDQAIYRGRSSLLLVDLGSGEQVEPAPWDGLPGVLDAVFLPDGKLACYVSSGGKPSWYRQHEAGFEDAGLPSEAFPCWSQDGDKLAYYRSPASKDVHIRAAGEEQVLEFTNDVVALAWSHAGDRLYAMMRDPLGVSEVLEIDPDSQANRIIARGLDGPSFANTLSLDADGTGLFLALVSDRPANPEARHLPEADRDLDIYRLEIATSALELYASGPGDEFDPQVRAGRLYWTNNMVQESIALLPSDGGDCLDLGIAGQLPGWNRDGSILAYTFGGWRIADWALNLDVAQVPIDAEGWVRGKPELIISGFHEDFTPSWSPDGRWMVYHSHRSMAAVPSYGSSGSADDLFLRSALDPSMDEIRLTDFGWEVGHGEWSPDGSEIAFSSWERGGRRGLHQLWVVKIDPQRGVPLYSEKLKLPPGLVDPMWTSWSPSSSEIAVEAAEEDGRRSLWVLRRDGGAARKIHEYAASTYGGLTWTTDASHIVFAASDGDRMQLFSIGKDGGEVTRLSDDSRNLLHPRASPDGKWIACTRLQWRKEIRALQL